jgi:hypothetical protein
MSPARCARKCQRHLPNGVMSRIVATRCCLRASRSSFKTKITDVSNCVVPSVADRQQFVDFLQRDGHQFSNDRLILIPRYNRSHKALRRYQALSMIVAAIFAINSKPMFGGM